MLMKKKVLMFVFILSLLMSACASGATEKPDSASTPESISAPTEVNETNKIVIAHTMGETVLEKPALRVVALEWTYVEDLLALGIQPVGIADVEGYKEWVKTPVALSPDVVDLGIRGEPNLETLASLNPDLIIEIKYSAEAYYDKLSAIAPTLVFDPYEASEGFDQYTEMRSTFMKIAEATGKQAEGEAALAHMDEKITDAHAKIEEAGLVGEKFVLTQMYSWDNAVYVRLFTPNGMATQIVEQIGLVPGWEDEFQQYGFSEVSIETLPELGDIHYFYVVNGNDTVIDSEKVSPLWASLDFVKNNHAYPLGGDTWLFGGPLSAGLLVDVVTGQLMK